MAANWQRGLMRLMRITNYPTEVVRVEDFTPWYRRIVFRGPELTASVEAFPALWLRLWVPNPAKGQDGLAQRGYTVVAMNSVDETFSLDFVLHDVAGPAGDWAKAVSVGERVEVALTPAKIDIPHDTKSLVLAGDSTALPAINSWLESVPSEVRTMVFLEEDHTDRDKLPRVERENGSWEWVTREGDRGAALARAMSVAATHQPGLYAWAAGEKTLVKHVRLVFREQLGLDRAHHFTQFYWIEGKATG
ncbi:siderophore-interacting protein [Microbacterium sp. 18062]|uniref:siderophore-interacting protein n=1 Tax=Microbacterium sp. 18062 TaxID=2681410 RepID=UPI00135CB332|nr:siderophore-interacting protein [Microbacterium sp. 18062]